MNGFKELQKKWYAILKKEGFKDIEDSFQFHGSYFKCRYSLVQYKHKLYYYQLACQFLERHDFASPTERAIWSHHANGMTHREIVLVTKKGGNFVNDTILRLRQIMQFEDQMDFDDEY